MENTHTLRDWNIGENFLIENFLIAVWPGIKYFGHTECQLFGKDSDEGVAPER